MIIIDKTNYKIKKNYLKYLARNDIRYIYNICKILNMQIYLKGGDNTNIDIDYKKNKDFNIDFVIKNIDLIINNIELFNKILKIIKEHDNQMQIINPKYKRYDYKTNIIDYINKIYGEEFNFV